MVDCDICVTYVVVADGYAISVMAGPVLVVSHHEPVGPPQSQRGREWCTMIVARKDGLEEESCCIDATINRA